MLYWRMEIEGEFETSPKSESLEDRPLELLGG